jgi:Transposase IS66 family
LGQWESLEVYLQEPDIEIDTNPVENAIRPLLARRTGYLSVMPMPGERSAIIKSCRRHGV